MALIIQMMPTARHIQPIGFLGRLEAIRAPTRGKSRKGSTKLSTPLAPPVPQLPGGCIEPVAMYSATDAAAMINERPASDHASQVAARWLTLASPRCCSLAPAVITPVYRTTV